MPGLFCHTTLVAPRYAPVSTSRGRLDDRAQRCVRDAGSVPAESPVPQGGEGGGAVAPMVQIYTPDASASGWYTPDWRARRSLRPLRAGLERYRTLAFWHTFKRSLLVAGFA